MSEFLSYLPVVLPVGIAVLFLVILAVTGYVKAPPDTALIISGMRKKPRVLIGKAGFRVPFFERIDKLSLKLIPLDIKTGDAVPTADCINIFVDSAVNVKLSPDTDSINIAAQNFLNKSTNEIGDILSGFLGGRLAMPRGNCNCDCEAYDEE